MYYPDISHWKPVKNWNEVKEACPFLISKSTQGTNYIDPTLDSFIKGCEANGIPYWLYTFLNRGNEKAQAEFMVKVCAPKVGKHFVGYVLDIESGNSAAGVQEALDYLKTQSAKTMIYTMYAQYSTYQKVIAGRGSSCAWWEARYGKNNGTYSSAYPPHAGVDLHQYTSNGNCPGIGSTVDLSRIAGSKKASWFKTVGSAKKETFPYKAVITGDVNVRKKASAKSAKVMIPYVIKAGKTVTITEKKGHFGKLKNGKGWISLNFTKKA